MFLGTETDVFGDGGTKTLPLGNVFLLRPQKHQPPFPKASNKKKALNLYWLMLFSVLNKNL